MQAKYVARLVTWVLVVLLLCTARSWGQDAEQVAEAEPPMGAENAAAEGAAPELPEISDEPKTIDPASLLPAELAAKATVDLRESSLREVVDWLEQEQGLVVLVEWNTLSDIGISPGEPISDHLEDAPIYLLLNRLRALDVAWYYEDEIVHLTSEDVAEERMSTVPYNVADLLDAGYSQEDLADTIESVVTPTNWDDVGGEGALSFLGDVMLVGQTDAAQLEIQGLLEALRGPGRQTFVFDPPQHLVLREKLEENVSVDFSETPLVDAAAFLAMQAAADIRLDLPALRKVGVRERQPVSLKLSERKLETVLSALLVDLNLTWVLRDGVIWITSVGQAEYFMKTAVYDVRDLCRDEAESRALRNAVISQTAQESWGDVGGPGEIVFAKPGILVVSNQEKVQTNVLRLLETYRAALRLSRPRPAEAVLDPQEVLTVYYRLHANVAKDLSTFLPQLVRPDSWVNDGAPGAEGTIFLVSSPAETSQVSLAGGGQAELLVVDRAVLVITQTREVHEEILAVIGRVESGDSWKLRPEAETGEMGGSGGFGGGFFQVTPEGRP